MYTSCLLALSNLFPKAFVWVLWNLVVWYICTCWLWYHFIGVDNTLENFPLTQKKKKKKLLNLISLVEEINLLETKVFFIFYFFKIQYDLKLECLPPYDSIKILLYSRTRNFINWWNWNLQNRSKYNI